MSAAWLVVRAGLRSRWRSWLALAVVAGLAGGLVTAVAAGARRTDAAYPSLVAWSKPPDDLFSVDSGPQFASVSLAEADRLPQVAAVGQVASYTVLSPAEIGVMAPADAAIPDTFWHRKLLAGRLPDPTRPDEADISFIVGQLTGLRVGGTLTVSLLGTSGKSVSVRFRVVGIDAAPSEFPPQYGGGVDEVWASPALVRKLRGSVANTGGFALRLRGGAAAVPVVEGEISRLSGGKAVSDYPLAPQAANTQRSIHLQAVALWLLAGLLALLGLVILGQLLGRLAAGDAADYATMRAVGMSPGQLMVAGLGRAALIGAAGALLAAVLAVAMSPAFPVGLAAIAEPHPGVAADWLALGLGMLAVLAATVGCAAWPSWKAASPARRAEPAVRVAAWSAAVRVVLPVPVAMGARLALQRGKGRTAVPLRSTVIASAVGVLGLAAALVFTSSFDHLLATPRLYGVSFDALVFPLENQPVGSLERVAAADPAVARWAPSYAGIPIEVNGVGVGVITTSGGPGAVTVAVPLQGSAPEAPGEIVLGERTLAAAGARIGGTVRVSIPGIGKPATRTVVGTAIFPAVADETQLGTGAEMTTQGLRGLLPPGVPVPPPGLVISFRTVAGAASRHSAAGWQGAGNPVSVTGGAVSAADQQRLSAFAGRADQVGPFGVEGPSTPVDLINFGQLQDLPLLLGLALGALALLTVAHLLLTAARRRRRELAVLRALGFTPRQVRAAVSWMAGTFAATALLTGVPLGIAAGRLAWDAFAAQLGIQPVPVIQPAWVAVLVTANLAIAVLVAAIPARSATRQAPASLLRAE